MINLNKKSLTDIFFIIFLIFIVIFLINSPLIYNFMWRSDRLFQDLLVNISWLKCNYLGFNVYLDLNENCPAIMGYGHIFLSIPFNNYLELLYINIFPYLFIFLFVTLVMFILKPKSLIEYLVFIFAIINPSTFLLIERMNIDILIFLLIFVLVYNRFYLINWFLIFFLTFFKIYPAILGLNIFLENKNRKLKNIILIILSLLIVSIIYLAFNYYEYALMFQGISGNKAGYHFLFSLNTIPKVFKYLSEIKYIYLILIFYSIFFCVVIFLNKKKYYLNNINFNDFYSYKFKLFMIGSYISIISFIFFSNFFHREVFLILTYPILFFLEKQTKNNFIKGIIYFILFRYFFLFLYSYLNIHDGIIHIDGERYFANYFLTIVAIKGVIDFIFMAIITSLTIFFTKSFFTEFKNNHIDK